jgi:hypothetical protein
MGTSSEPLSQPTDADIFFIKMPRPPKNTQEGKDARIRLLRELFVIVSDHNKLKLLSTSDDDVVTWFDSTVNILFAVDRLRRLALPLDSTYSLLSTILPRYSMTF